MLHQDFCKSVRYCQACHVRKDAILPVPPEMKGDRVDYWLIGQCPGETEDKQNRPFSPDAPAGKICREIMQIMEIHNNYMISNSLFCHPTNNRTPTAEEIAFCMKQHKIKEWELVKNCKAIILFGKPTTAVFLKYTYFSEVVNKFFTTQVMGETKLVGVLYHPSYFARKQKEWNSIKETVIVNMRDELKRLINADKFL